MALNILLAHPMAPPVIQDIPSELPRTSWVSDIPPHTTTSREPRYAHQSEAQTQSRVEKVTNSALVDIVFGEDGMVHCSKIERRDVGGHRLVCFSLLDSVWGAYYSSTGHIPIHCDEHSGSDRHSTVSCSWPWIGLALTLWNTVLMTKRHMPVRRKDAASYWYSCLFCNHHRNCNCNVVQ